MISIAWWTKSQQGFTFTKTQDAAPKPVVYCIAVVRADREEGDLVFQFCTYTFPEFTFSGGGKCCVQYSTFVMYHFHNWKQTNDFHHTVAYFVPVVSYHWHISRWLTDWNENDIFVTLNCQYFVAIACLRAQDKSDIDMILPLIGNSSIPTMHDSFCLLSIIRIMSWYYDSGTRCFGCLVPINR